MFYISEENISILACEEIETGATRTAMAPVSVDERAHLLPGPGDPRRTVRANSLYTATYTSIGDMSPLNRRRGSRILPQNNTGLPPPVQQRKMSRIRTNSVSILNDDGDDIIATSFGPVLLPDAPTRSFLQAFIVLIGIITSRTPLLPASIKDRILVILQGLLSGGRVFLQENNGTTIVPTTTTTPFTTELPTTTPSMEDFNISTTLTDLEGRPWPKLEKLVEVTGLKAMHDSYLEEEHPTGPAYGVKYYIGVVLALSTAIIGSTANVIIAKCESVSSSVMVFYSGLGGVVLALACSFMDPSNRIIFDITSIPYDEWLILFMLGCSGLIGYYSMTRSLQLIPPTTVAVLRALEIILAYIAQAVVMGEIPNTLAITGSTIVMFSVIAFALEETILSCYNCY